MVEYLNDVLTVLAKYVSFLFSLELTTGVSVGSILLVATLLWIITINFWVRG